MVVGESKRNTSIMDGIENTGDVRLHDHRLRLKQRFDIVRKLGQGTYGKVQLGINKKTGQEVAIKTIKKCKIESEADLVRIRREVQIMSSVRHPNIVHIYEVFENSEKMILVMEYCSGGELYDYLSQKKVLQEDEARRLFRQIATAVYYCHIHKICHRDLKLENVLLDDTGSAKIADFGLSNVFKETSLLSTFCGSPLYASPEIVKGTPYIGPEVDCWSLGVLLYTLVYGAMPFDGSNFKRLVRQISNGDYYEPVKNPSSASPLIRDMLTVDPLKRADIAYICDNPWVNLGCETSCLEMAQALAAETPVRLDLLLSLAPAAPAHSLVVPPEGELGTEESGTDLTSSASMAVEPSNSAEKRILDLVAEGGEDAIKPSPTRTIVSAGENKRKLGLAVSASGLRKDRLPSCANLAPQAPLREEGDVPSEEIAAEPQTPPQTLKSSATITITPTPVEIVKDLTKEIVKPMPKEEDKTKGAKSRAPAKKIVSPSKEEKSPEKEEAKPEQPKPAPVAAAAEKQESPPATNNRQPASPPAPVTKPKKLSIPGGTVGSFKDQFERRASLTTSPEIKRNISKPVVSKIAKPKAQSEDRDLKSPDNGSVRLQQIGIEPSVSPPEQSPLRGGVKKTESEPARATPVDPAVLLQDARRSLQNSMAKLAEEKVGPAGEDRRRARDIISTVIKTGKPPMPYGRSSSAGVTSLSSPPATPPAPAARLFRTEAQHRVEDHRALRGVSVERIIPIHVSEEAPTPAAPPAAPPAPPATPPTKHARAQPPPLRRLVSSESGTSEACSSPGEPIKKSAREFIIPIAVEGKGYVTPRPGSREPERLRAKPKRITSLVSGGESEEEDDTHMHRLRSTRAARAESVSSGEEDEEDEGFHLLTSENLFSTLLHRVRALTNRLNGEEGPGFPQHASHSLFNNLQSPFFNSSFNSPHLPRRHLLREGWGGRDLHADFDAMFNKSRQNMPRGGLGAGDAPLAGLPLSDAERRALSGLTPALARRLRRQLLRHLPTQLRRTISFTNEPGQDSAGECEAEPADYCTLPRLKKTRDVTTPSPQEESASAEVPAGGRRTPERSLLGKYLSPERAPEPARRHSLRLPGEPPRLPADPPRLPADSPRLPADPPRKRVSRFLRSDFFDSSPEENAYVKHKKEKELETQKVLREIREKRNKSAEPGGLRSPAEYEPLKDEGLSTRKCLSPVGILLAKERSRSNTPFFPMLDNIKETMDSAALASSRALTDDVSRSQYDTDTKLIRPRSYPVKSLDAYDGTAQKVDNSVIKETENKDKTLTRESKLMRPKSYPASSPSPEKVYITPNAKKEDTKLSKPKLDTVVPEKTDVEVSFSITLPKKSRTITRTDSKLAELSEDNRKQTDNINVATMNSTKPVEPVKSVEPIDNSNKSSVGTLVVKKYQIINSNDNKPEKIENGVALGSNISTDNTAKSEPGEDTKLKVMNHASTKEDVKLKSIDPESSEKKGTIKKKIIRKVSSKSKTDTANIQDANDTKAPTEKKKVTKKVKEKTTDDSSKTSVPKKKSVLQSIGHKLEKLASTKSSSPEKVPQRNSTTDVKQETPKSCRMQREQSVPVSSEPPTESNLIKRAVTLTDVAALENQTPVPSKTTVSKVLGLFKKFEPKEKVPKATVEKVDIEITETKEPISEFMLESPDKPKRPTSLLLNGLGRKNKYGRTTSDNVSTTAIARDDQLNEKKENEPKNRRNSLKLDFSRLPRVKKIVPTNPVIEPQIMSISPVEKETDKSEILEKNGAIPDGISTASYIDTRDRSRSRSRSSYSNSEIKSDHSADIMSDSNPLSPSEYTKHHPHRNHENTSPDKEDIIDRIRRKSFYSRFNEKKQRRKSNLVGPGATEYDPVARIHGPPAPEPKFDVSPTSPVTYDLSPGFSVASDLSPSTERYRSLLTEMPSMRNNIRYDNYGKNDKIDTYRSLDRNNFRKYPGTRSYLDYDQPLSYGAHRYSRTRSLLDSSDRPEDMSLGHFRDPHKYNRTLSMYSPGNYATYRPKRTLNSAIILKESEKEPSPENILDKIRQRKNISISVTRKPDPEKDSLPRSDVPSKSKGDSTECLEETH